jgi:hydroxysqualene dehydroxylase
MSGSLVHVIGAGLAGLAAALRVRDRGKTVLVHEAAGQAGGRARSYRDDVFGTMIDNGNHLVLSGNHATRAYLKRLGAEHRLSGPPAPVFPFIDLVSQQRWCVRPNQGRLPWWVLVPQRRVPDTRARDYFGLARLLFTNSRAIIPDVVDCGSLLYQRLWRPLLLAALNTDPRQASAALAGAVLRETLFAGGHACRPLIAAQGLAGAFVDPALAALRQQEVGIAFGRRLRAIVFGSRRVEELDFGSERVRLGASDAVILAVPSWVAIGLVPGLKAPTEFRAIVNAHFRVEPPTDFSPMTGVVNGMAEWIFCFSDRIAVTISAADRLLDAPRQTLATDIWREVAVVTGLAVALPPWQIIKERRATFAALPQENAKRPSAASAWDNLFLAGDWTATGLPATIEGAIRSGNRAADLAVLQVE